MAAEIVGKWRKAVEAGKKKGPSSSGNTAASKTVSPSASTPQSKTASPAPATSGGYKGDPEKRKFDVDGVDVNRTGIQSRDNCIGLMYNGLAFRSVEAPDRVLTKAIEVEKAAFVAYKGETTEYRAKLRSLFQNLKNRSNPALARRVVSGEITAGVFVVMSSDELKSAHLKQLESDLANENMKKAQVPMAEKSISDALTCGKCKQKKVSYTQAQTRSADEPMTTFCECMVCGHRWKVGKDPCDSHCQHSQYVVLTTPAVLVNTRARFYQRVLFLYSLLAGRQQVQWVLEFFWLLTLLFFSCFFSLDLLILSIYAPNVQTLYGPLACLRSRDGRRGKPKALVVEER